MAKLCLTYMVEVTLLNWTCIFDWYICKSDKKTHSNLSCAKLDRQKGVNLAKKRCENRIFLCFQNINI